MGKTRTRSIAIFAIAFLAFCASCQGKAQPRLPEAEIAIKGRTIRVELARSPKEQERGLMFRQELGKDRGMLFVFAEDERQSFWMKNTLIPLSIAYISSSGRIEDIFDMEPLSLAPVKTSHYVRYALEVPRGYFGEIGAAVGDQVELPEELEGPSFSAR